MTTHPKPRRPWRTRPGHTPRSLATSAGAVVVAGTLLVAGALLAGCSGDADGASARGATTARADRGTSTSTTSTPADPADPGPYQVGHHQQVFTDTEGHQLATSVWYPVDPATTGTPGRYDVLGFPVDSFGPMLDSAPAATGRFPVVLFSHGQGGLRVQSTFLTEALAGHGFVVVSADHLGDSLLGSLSGAPPITYEEMRARRVQEARFLIDRVLGTDDTGTAPWSGHVDHDRIGATGHSLGGYTALGLAVGTGATSGTLPGDPRVRAVAALAPGPEFGADPQGLAAMEQPLLIIGGTEDLAIKPAGDNIWERSGSPARFRVDLEGAGHDSFTILCDADQYLSDPSIPDNIRTVLQMAGQDNCGANAPSMPDAQAQRLVTGYLVAFFARYLSDDDRFASSLAAADGATWYDDDHPPPTTTTEPPQLAPPIELSVPEPID